MKYYMYKYVDSVWKYVQILKDHESLIYFLYGHQQKTSIHWYTQRSDGYWYDCLNKKHYNNTILDNINMSGKDISYESKSIYVDGFFHSFDDTGYIRPYMFFDEDNRIIDVRIFYKDILNYKPEPHHSYWHWRGYKGSRYHSERSLKYGRIIRMVKHPDFKEYNRIGNLEPIIHDMIYWDRPSRHYDRSWKTSYKCKKQYQKADKQKNRK